MNEEEIIDDENDKYVGMPPAKTAIGFKYVTHCDQILIVRKVAGKVPGKKAVKFTEFDYIDNKGELTGRDRLYLSATQVDRLVGFGSFKKI